MVQLFYGTFLTEGVREGKVCPMCWFLAVTGPHCCVLSSRHGSLKSSTNPGLALTLAFLCVTMDT